MVKIRIFTYAVLVLVAVFFSVGVLAQTTYSKGDYVKLVSNTYKCTDNCETVYEVCPLDKTFDGFDLKLYDLEGVGASTLKADKTVYDELGGATFTA